jgi:hypothetical protein
MKQIIDYGLDYKDFKDIELPLHFPSLIPFFASKTKMDKYYADEMVGFLKTLSPDLEIQLISFYEFKYSDASFDKEFENLLCSEYMLDDDLILAIDNEIFKLKYSDYNQFIDIIYPDFYQMDFYQPTDFFFINLRIQSLKLVSHAGFLVVYP